MPLLYLMLAITVFAQGRPTPLPTASAGMHVTVKDGGQCAIPIEDELNTIIGWTSQSLAGAAGTIVVQYDHTVFVKPDPDQDTSNDCLDPSGNWRLDVSQLVECVEVEDAFGQLRSHCGPDAPPYAPGPPNYCWPSVCSDARHATKKRAARSGRETRGGGRCLRLY